MKLRQLVSADLSPAAEIWSTIFGDSDRFVNWFFHSRFFPAYSACAEEDGRIAAIMHGMPVPIGFAGTVIPGALLSGVATMPAFRGRGLMKALMAFETENLRQLGCRLLTHTPVDPVIYRSCDQYLCSTEISFRFQRAVPCPSLPVSEKWDPAAALKCYQAFASRYIGIIRREETLMRLRAEDFFADGGQCRMLESGAYCFYSRKGASVLCHELVYYREEEALALLASFEADSVTGRLPGDFSDTAAFMQWKRQGHAVFYPLDESLLPRMNDSLSPGRKMQEFCRGRNCFIWEEY